MPVTLLLNTKQKNEFVEALKVKKIQTEFDGNSAIIDNDKFLNIVDAVNEYYLKLYLKSQKSPLFGHRMAITEQIINRLENIRAFFEPAEENVDIEQPEVTEE